MINWLLSALGFTPKEDDDEDRYDGTQQEILILHILARYGRPMYGLEIVDASEGELSRGGVYVFLDKLEDHGLVTSTKAPRKKGYKGLLKSLYEITKKGRGLLSRVEQRSLVPSNA